MDKEFEDITEHTQRGKHRSGAATALVVFGGPCAGMVVGGIANSFGYGIAACGVVWLFGLMVAVVRAMGV